MESFVLIIAATLGALIGSFTNVLIYRIPIKKSIAFPPSACPNCSHRLGVLDLVPIFSWLALGGKCRYCRNPISSRYPLIEAVSALGYLAIAWKVGLLENPILDDEFDLDSERSRDRELMGGDEQFTAGKHFADVLRMRGFVRRQHTTINDGDAEQHGAEQRQPKIIGSTEGTFGSEVHTHRL